MKFVIVGMHRSVREFIGWAGKEGFVPLTAERRVGNPPAQLKIVPGDVAEELMKQITKQGVGRKYEFAAIPVVEGTTQVDEGRSESGLILPHSIH